MPRRALTSFEMSILGIIWRDGPCTTYAVVTRAANSPSSFFRKRASSVYAVTLKLIERGYVVPVDGEAGSRGERDIRATEAGAAALRQWIEELPPVEVAYSNDLIRLRVNFLSALHPEERVEFVELALSSLREYLSDQQKAIEAVQERFKRVAAIGLMHETRARIAWLEEVQEILTKEASV